MLEPHNPALADFNGAGKQPCTHFGVNGGLTTVQPVQNLIQGNICKFAHDDLRSSKLKADAEYISVSFTCSPAGRGVVAH